MVDQPFLNPLARWTVLETRRLDRWAVTMAMYSFLVEEEVLDPVRLA